MRARCESRPRPADAGVAGLAAGCGAAAAGEDADAAKSAGAATEFIDKGVREGVSTAEASTRCCSSPRSSESCPVPLSNRRTASAATEWANTMATGASGETGGAPSPPPVCSCCAGGELPSKTEKDSDAGDESPLDDDSEAESARAGVADPSPPSGAAPPPLPVFPLTSAQSSPGSDAPRSSAVVQETDRDPGAPPALRIARCCACFGERAGRMARDSSRSASMACRARLRLSSIDCSRSRLEFTVVDGWASPSGSRSAASVARGAGTAAAAARLRWEPMLRSSASPAPADVSRARMRAKLTEAGDEAGNAASAAAAGDAVAAGDLAATGDAKTASALDGWIAVENDGDSGGSIAAESAAGGSIAAESADAG